MNSRAELVFIPSPGLSHLVSTVEAAKLLLHRDNRLSITVLIMKIKQDSTVDSYTQKTSSNAPSTLRLINVPTPETSSPLFDKINDHITPIRDIISNLITQPSDPDSRLAGLVLDMFCTKFMEVAEEFSLPSYVFFTSSACALGLFQYIVAMKFEHNQDPTSYKGSDAELEIPCFSNPVPAKVFPPVILDGGPMADLFIKYFSTITKTKGIMVNTFHELETYAIESLLSDGKTPKVYPVGPILNNSGGDRPDTSFDDVKKWLDDQPESSVVFLCFGTMGSFEEDQVREIAMALEQSGHRFLWSLRKPAPKDGVAKFQFVVEYEDFGQVLPEGFLDRTKGVGRVIGWAPQVAVLSHPAVGGFVSHCGWNSTLESVWFGVPMATFPLYSEQQMNAFQLVRELGMAEMIRLDYSLDLRRERKAEVVRAEEIEAAIRRLMAEEGCSGVRQKVKEMQKKARSALMEGGSSFNAQCQFIEDVIKNVS